MAIIKHSNPCGIAIGADLADAHRKAHACDPVSAFGGVIAANGTVTAELAGQIADVFTEVVIAPGFDPERAWTSCRRRRTSACWPARRRTAVPAPNGGRSAAACSCSPRTGSTRRATTRANWELKAGAALDELTLGDLAFAWRACRSVKSNAILLASGGASVGIGMGQVNRVDSCRLRGGQGRGPRRRLGVRQRRVLPVP